VGADPIGAGTKLPEEAGLRLVPAVELVRAQLQMARQVLAGTMAR
jgi:hypothetical protein